MNVTSMMGQLRSPVFGSQMTALNRIEKLSLEKQKERMVKEGAASIDDIDEIAVEYKKFLALIVLENGNSVRMSGKVDDMWHTHIIYTKEYIDMCNDIYGKYIHHHPNDDLSLVGESITINRLKKYFVSVKERYWMSESGAMCNSCNSCSSE